MSERAVVFKIDRETPQAQKTPAGYAAVPREVTRRKEVTAGAHRVLTAILGLCYGDARFTRATTRAIAIAAGMHPCTVRRHFIKLTKLGLVTRRPDQEVSGGPWLTYVLCHPKEFVLTNEPFANWRIKSQCTDAQPPIAKVRTPLPQKCAPPYSKSAQGDLFKQTLNLKDDDVPPSNPKTVVVVSAASPPESNSDQQVIAELVAKVHAQWPDEPNVERRMAELVGGGAVEAALAVEYAVLMEANGLAYAFKTRDRWHCSGYDLSECEAEVRAKRPKQAAPALGRMSDEEAARRVAWANEMAAKFVGGNDGNGS